MNTHSAIHNYLLQLGFSPRMKGFRYLSELLQNSLTDDIFPLHRVGYPILAQYHATTTVNIDKNIQNAISHAFLRAQLDELYLEFGETLDPSKGKPTAKQFLCHAREKLLSIVTDLVV